jgi:hypothetical protein
MIHGGKKFGYAETLQVMFDFTNKSTFKSDIDPDLLRMYRANLRQILYDILVVLIIGTLIGGAMATKAKDLTNKAQQTGSVTDGLIASAANINARIVSNSALDFAFWDAIGTPLG